jgi:thiopeptide-type bacteriocin biosynthesis protein
MQDARAYPLSWSDTAQRGKDQEAGGEDWLYVRIACQATEADRVLLKLVAPLAQHFREQGLICQWFFIRYYEGGHHLRVRFCGEYRDLFGSVKTLVSEQLGTYCAGNQDSVSEALDQGPEGINDQSWQPLYAANALRPVPSYEYQRYEPEIARYGGPQGLRVSEQHFASSSATALQVLEWEQAGSGSRRNAALLLIHASTECFQLDAERRVASFEQFYLHRRDLVWQIPLDESLLEQAYMRNRINLQRLIPRSSHLPVQRGQRVWLPLLEQWQDSLRATYQAIQDLQAQNRLSTPPVVMLSAYIHMLCNRLGIYPREEAHLCYLLYRMYTEQLAMDQASF